MIDAAFTDAGGKLEMVMKGHAGFDMAGKDIVCASASMLAFSLLYGLEGVPEITAECEVSPGYMRVAGTDTVQTRAMYAMCCAGLKNLSQQYPRNVCTRGEVTANPLLV